MTCTRDENPSTSELNTENCFMTFVVHSPPLSYIWSSAAACLVNVVLAIAGTILNSLVLFAYWKSPKLRSKLHDFTIATLSSIDVLVTTLVHPFFQFKSRNEVFRRTKCWHASTYYLALLFFSGASFWTLFTMSIKKYLSIVHPLLHRVKITKRRFIFTCNFFYSIHVTSLNIQVYAVSLSWIAIVVLAITCGIYIFAFIFIFLVDGASIRRKTPGDCPAVERKSEMAFIRRLLKLAKSLLAIVAMYVIGFMPLGVVGQLKSPWDRHQKAGDGVAYALSWTTITASMSSTLNCFVFFWANRELRKEGMKIVKNCCSR